MPSSHISPVPSQPHPLPRRGLEVHLASVLVLAGPERPALPALGAACGCRLWAGGRMSCPCWGGLLRLLPHQGGVFAVATGQRPPVLICPGTLDKVFPDVPCGRSEPPGGRLHFLQVSSSPWRRESQRLSPGPWDGVGRWPTAFRARGLPPTTPQRTTQPLAVGRVWPWWLAWPGSVPCPPASCPPQKPSSGSRQDSGSPAFTCV